MTNRELAAQIAAAHLRRNQLGSDQLASLILIVHQALVGLGKSADAVQPERTPAVSVRRSIHRDYVVCLDCGWKGQMLKRHLTTAHGLTVDDYRARWKLPRDHALVALAYSERRSTISKRFGLGRHGRRALGEIATIPEAAAETPTQPGAKRRRPPRTARS